MDALEKYGRAPRRYPKLEDHFAQMAEQATAADTPKHRCWLVCSHGLDFCLNIHSYMCNIEHRSINNIGVSTTQWDFNYNATNT